MCGIVKILNTRRFDNECPEHHTTNSRMIPGFQTQTGTIRENTKLHNRLGIQRAGATHHVGDNPQATRHGWPYTVACSKRADGNIARINAHTYEWKHAKLCSL
jgi:hypothetical protein